MNAIPLNLLLQQAYIEACEAELRAFKPGNVSIHSEGHGMTVEQFRVSAQCSAPWLVDDHLSLGEKIFYAVETTVSAVGCNTNLGIVLLAAPLLKAAVEVQLNGISLREALSSLLETTTVQDANWVYRAIRLANPGGLGQAEQHDVINPPSVTLEEAMFAARNRDRIAYQYVNCYADVFDLAVPSYHYALSRFGSEDWAVLSVFTNLLKNIPDSHIERKFGSRHHQMVTDRMISIHQAMSTSVDDGQIEPLLCEIDTEFKQLGINPGTTADLTVACVLAVRLERVLGQGRRCAESDLIV